MTKMSKKGGDVDYLSNMSNLSSNMMFNKMGNMGNSSSAMNNFANYITLYDSKFNSLDQKQLDIMMLFFSNLLLFAANKQDNQFDRNYFTLMSYYIYVLYQLTKQSSTSYKSYKGNNVLQNGGNRMIWRNGAFIFAPNDYVLQEGDVDVTANMMFGWQQGQNVVNAGHEFMNNTAPQPQQMVRDEYAERMQRLNDQHEESMLRLRQQTEVELMRSRMEMLRGRVPLSAYPSIVGSSVGFGCSAAICLECTTQLCRNMGENLVQGVGSLAQAVPGSQLANASYSFLHTVDNIAARSVRTVETTISDVTDTGSSILTTSYEFLNNYVQSFFASPEPTRTVIEAGFNATASMNDELLEQALLNQTNRGIMNNPQLQETIMNCFQSLEQYGSRSSITMGLCVCVTCCCFLYKNQLDRAQQRRADLVMTTGQRQLEDQRSRETMANYGRMAAAAGGMAFGGPFGYAAANAMPNTPFLEGMRRRNPFSGGKYKKMGKKSKRCYKRGSKKTLRKYKK